MSRSTTTSEIIARGLYLEPNFDATSLTVAQLTGLFIHHQIKSPSGANKARLVELFESEIKAKSKKLKKQRLVQQESIASGDGILDGISGLPLETPVRRSSRRLSREPSVEVAPSEPPKRRRSAVPSLGRPSAAKKPATQQPILIEESESEEEEAGPVRKVSRSKKDSEAAGSSGRRVSQKFGPGTPDSWWEDNNIFQSGAESSSPVRSPPPKPMARKSSGRKSRTSLSAPPDVSSSPPRVELPGSRMHPPRSNFEPNLPSAVNTNARLSWGVPPSPLKNEDDLSFDGFDDTSGFADVSTNISGPILEEEEEEQAAIKAEEEEEESVEEDSQTVAVSRRLAGGADEVVRHSQSAGRPIWKQLLFSLIFLAGVSIVTQYKLDSATIGYCDTASDTNEALVKREIERRMIEGCHAQRTDDGDPDACPPLPLIPLPHGTSCTPCPPHASCTRTNVTCEDGFLLQLSLLSRLPILPAVVDGLPGLGPIAFPPSCVEDPNRKRNIGSVGKIIDMTLARERGKKLCASTDTSKPVDGGEARRWGIAAERLKADLKPKAPPQVQENFNALFAEAVHQLLNYGRLLQDYDSEGNEYLATEHVEMGWNCRVAVAAKRSWYEWQHSVLGVLLLGILGWYGKARAEVRQAEKRRVAELVQIALDALRNQEMAYHTDPITTPRPYLSSLQLRDYVLQDEHTIARRRRLWDEVEKIVEGNTNVRANLEEIEGGDETRVWRWVGGSSAGTPGVKLRHSANGVGGDLGDRKDNTGASQRRHVA